MNKEYKSNYFTIEELPLTAEDREKLKKDISNHFAINILLLPLLFIILFWGILYFSIFAVFTLLWNVYALKVRYSVQKEMASPKIIITGKITDKAKRPDGDSNDTIIFFGTEKFDITYVSNSPQLEINDMISLHYSQTVGGNIRMLLKIEK